MFNFNWGKKKILLVLIDRYLKVFILDKSQYSLITKTLKMRQKENHVLPSTAISVPHYGGPNVYPSYF